MPQPASPGAPTGLPSNAERVVLPHTEVCIHLRVAGHERWAAKVAHDAAQIYDDNGRPYSAPVLLSEAGLDERGEPKPAHRPAAAGGTAP